MVGFGIGPIRLERKSRVARRVSLFVGVCTATRLQPGCYENQGIIGRTTRGCLVFLGFTWVVGGF